MTVFIHMSRSWEVFWRGENGVLTKHHWDCCSVLKTEELDKRIHTKCCVPHLVPKILRTSPIISRQENERVLPLKSDYSKQIDCLHKTAKQGHRIEKVIMTNSNDMLKVFNSLFNPSPLNKSRQAKISRYIRKFSTFKYRDKSTF